MPLYEYHCKVCGKEFELIAAMSAPLPKRGPDCISTKCSIEKLLSRPAASPRFGSAEEASGQVAAPAAEAHQCTSGCAHDTPDISGY